MSDAEANTALAGLTSAAKRRDSWSWWLRVFIVAYAVLVVLQWFVFDPDPPWLTPCKSIAAALGFFGVWGYLEARVSVLEEAVAAIAKAYR